MPRKAQLPARSAYEVIYEVVRSIPRGKVLTYGLVSHLINGRMSAQGVGWALNALGTSKKSAATSANVPWQRVINARGQLSTYKNPDIPQGLQRALLEEEGIEFDSEDRIDLDRYLWHEGIAQLANQELPSRR
jgi:methylated-DNA-protein-cysteine methyltransferase-like protein